MSPSSSLPLSCLFLLWPPTPQLYVLCSLSFQLLLLHTNWCYWVMKRPGSYSFTSSPAVRSSCGAASPSSPPPSSATAPGIGTTVISVLQEFRTVRAAASRFTGNRIFFSVCPEAVICLSQQQAVLSNYLLVVFHGYILLTPWFSWPDKQRKYFLWSLPTPHFQPWPSIRPTQAWAGSHQSLWITMLPHHAVAGCAGIVVCNSCSHHCSTWGPGEGAALAQRRPLGMGRGCAKFGSSPSSCSCRPGQHIRVMVRGNELPAKCECASGVDHRDDFISFLLAPLSCSAWPFGPGLAVIQPIPTFIKAEPQITLASQGVWQLVIIPVSLHEHIFFLRSHQVSPMASGEHPELMEQWTGASLLYLPELETATS